MYGLYSAMQETKKDYSFKELWGDSWNVLVNTLVILESSNVDLKYLAFEFDLKYSRRLNVVMCL